MNYILTMYVISFLLLCRGAESETAYAEALYSNVTFMQSFFNSLSDDGVLVTQLGESPDTWDPDEMKSGDMNRVAALNLLETVGFESIHAYEEVSHDWSDHFPLEHCLIANEHCSFFFAVSLWIWFCMDIHCGL